MIQIKLVRFGTKRKPFYKILVADKRRKARGVAIDNVGFWQPSKDYLEVDKKKITSWQEKGAKLTKAVENLITKT